MEYKDIDVIDILTELKDDISVPKNIRTKVEDIIKIFNGEKDIQIKVSKALNELEEIVNDVNLQPYTRTQIWNVISSLEKMQQ